LTLPFVSYGGSSLITTCVMVALILRVDYENRLARAGHPSVEPPE
jgi:cell division protein FtsW